MIAFFSDYQDDVYVGIVKGKILSFDPGSKIVDLFHKVKPQNIREGAWILLQSFQNFPKNTVFLAIVDPGVGTARNCIAVETRNYFFVGPDNGLLFPAAKKDGIISIAELQVPKTASKTFHGRDVFAKAAAKLDSSNKLSSVGKKVDSIEELSFFLDKRQGEVVRIDSFGNIITNLKPLDKDSYILRCNGKQKKLDFFESYSQAKNDVFVIVGSSGTLELSVKNGSAAEKMSLSVSDRIELV